MDIISRTLMETEGLNYAKVESILFRNLCELCQADIAAFFLFDQTHMQVKLKRILPEGNKKDEKYESFQISTNLYHSISSSTVERWSEIHDFYHEILPPALSNRLKKSTVNWLHLNLSFGGSTIAFALIHIVKKVDIALLKSYMHIAALILQRSYAFSNLKKTRLELDSVYGSISDIILLLNQNLEVLWTNKMGSYYFGNDLTGEPIYKVLHDGTPNKDDLLLRSVLKDKVNKEFERTIITSDGKKKNYQCIASCAGENNKGEATSCIIFFRDITSQKRQKSTLLLLNDKINRSQKALIRQRSHNILGKLYSDMFEELSQGIERTHESLSRMEDLFDELKEEKRIPESIKQEFNQLKESFRFSETLENSFHNLVFIRQVSRELNPYYLNQSTAEIRSLLKPFRTGEVRLEEDYGELPVIKVMAVEVNVAIYELLKNAIDALTYPHPRENALVSIKTWADDQWVYLNIQDNGPGLVGQNMLSIFDFFESTKHHVTGVGVGMMVVNEYIVNRHNGNLSLDTQRDDGSSFTISLPIKERGI